MRNICRGLVIEGGQVLMVQEKLGRAKGLWTFPGGDQEDGETKQQAAVREILEETNLTVQVTSRLHEHRLSETMVWHAFLCRLIGDYSPVFQSKELYGGGLFLPEQLPAMRENLRDPDLMIGAVARAFAATA